MKSKILIFISLITYILTGNAAAVTLSSVATGSCKDKKYTFVIKANADGDLAAGSATVTLTSPENTTPTCTFAAVSTTQSGETGGSGGTTGGETGGSGGTTGGETGGRRLAAGDFDITCEITSKLDNAEIKVNAVTVNKITATPTTGTFPLTMDGKATCEGTTTTTTTTTTNTTNTTTTTTEAAKFIQFSGFLFLFILTVF